jgi:uncharacterized BrkB/YihY/UPF0761 family membrane protein
VYYSAQILFFGAEFTKVYAREGGSRPSLARAEERRANERRRKERRHPDVLAAT